MDATAPTPPPVFFIRDIISSVATKNQNNNFIFGPSFVKCTLGTLSLAAAGTTSFEIRRALDLSTTSDRETKAEFLKITKRVKIDPVKFMQLTRIFVDFRYQITQNFHDNALELDVTIASCKFIEPDIAVTEINNWIKEQTQNNIENLFDIDSIASNTNAILLNTVFFKAKWAKCFEALGTKQKPFYLTKNKRIGVNMMFQEGKFLYGELKQINAIAIEIPYEGSQVTMTILLPTTVDGLQLMETRMRDVEFDKLLKKLKPQNVKVHIPRIKLLFSLSLKQTLEDLGIKSLFSPTADLTNMLDVKTELSIAEFKQAILFNIDELGTGVTGKATVVPNHPLTLVLNEVVYEFNADHPFFFAIKDQEHIYFAGHIVNFSEYK